MVEVTRKALQCDYPECLAEEEVERISLVIRQRKLEVDLCAEHQGTVTIAEVEQYAHRRPRSRGVVPVDPSQIPRTTRRRK